MDLQDGKSIKVFLRQEIYDLVWLKPISRILKDYALKRTEFKKLCKDNNIPLPENGYWQKLRFNKKVVKPELPDLDIKQIKIKLPLRKDFEESDKASDMNLLTKKIKKNENLELETSYKLVKPEKIIVATRDYLRKLKKVEYSSLLEDPKDGLISISVTDKITNRALKFADTFIKNLKERGHKVIVVKGHRYTNYNGTKYVIHGEYFDMRIREVNRREMVKHPNYDWEEAKYHPTGKLNLKVDNHPSKEWQDSKTILLEEKLSKIIEHLELTAKNKTKERIERKKMQALWEEEKRIEVEIKRKIGKEVSDFKSLINSSGRWHKSVSLRAYLDAFEVKAIENNTLNENKTEWLKWARKKADWYDPFVESEDETFKNIDRDSF